MDEPEGNGRCFVISPIGEAGSPEREHADAVFAHIIKPAVEQHHLVAVRSDHIEAPGLISAEMYQRILGDDLCVVVLTGMNPNVLYELAIAHAAARPVVLLIAKGEQTPFDLKDHRHIVYDLSNHDALRGGVYADDMARSVAALFAADEPPTVAFDRTLSPLGAVRGAAPSAGRAERAALCAFFGARALDDEGITVTVPVYQPLVYDNFASTTEVTMARKVDQGGEALLRPIYGDVLHFDDYTSAQEVFALLRELGARGVELRRDADFLGQWGERACVVCLGSPFVNAALGELGQLSEDIDGAWVSGTRTSPTLDTYRVVTRRPHNLDLGVDQVRALGVIARMPNPSSPESSVVAIWGCRAQSTFAAARYLHRSFAKVASQAGAARTVVVLAVRGKYLNVVDPMYVAADDVVVERNDDLLRHYLRTVAPDTGPGASGDGP